MDKNKIFMSAYEKGMSPSFFPPPTMDKQLDS